LITKYALFARAKSIGIKFGPNDLTIEQINDFAMIESVIKTEMQRKHTDGQ